MYTGLASTSTLNTLRQGPQTILGYGTRAPAPADVRARVAQALTDRGPWKWDPFARLWKQDLPYDPTGHGPLWKVYEEPEGTIPPDAQGRAPWETGYNSKAAPAPTAPAPAPGGTAGGWKWDPYAKLWKQDLP